MEGEEAQEVYEVSEYDGFWDRENTFSLERKPLKATDAS